MRFVYRLCPRHGAEVFDEEEDAVEELLELIGDRQSTIPEAVLRGFIDRIVQADRVLALVAISDALARHGSSGKIAKAQSESIARGRRFFG